MKTLLSIVLVCILALSFAGCATAPSMKDDKELNALFEALAKYNAETEKKRAERLGKGIKKLVIEKTADDFNVSADLEHALIPEVVKRMFDESGRAYLLEGAELYGSVSARFDNILFTDALNLILKPVMLSAEDAERITVIKPRTVEKTEAPVTIHKEIPLINLDTKAAIDLLGGLYPKISQRRAVDFGPLPASNRIFLKGPENEVFQAIQTLMKADREIEHVVIEMLVVEFSSSALEELGTKLQGYGDGKYENVNVDFGSIGGDIISFSKLTEDGLLAANRLTRFSAVINLMISNNMARLISRPYISALSGSKAKIDIASDRYVVVDDVQGRASTKSITAGVILQIVPTVLQDGRLRMDLQIEDSQFSDINVANVSTEVKKNTANTVMQVEDGQTIVIGGLILNRRAWANTGFPFLRHIPGLNLLFSNEGDIVEEKEVAIYVTPHVWKPGMISPLIKPEALTGKDESFIQKLK